MKLSSSSRIKLFYTTGIVALFLLVLYRAFHLDITFDEVYTIDLASQPISDILFNARNFQSANNHILNSILIKPFILLFGKEIIAIRLPNVIASLFFFIGNMQLAKKICSSTLGQLSAFVILSLNLYLLDFFSLSRGYGLALMFEVWSLYFFFHFLQRRQLKYTGLCFLFAALAVLSNFTWINFYLPLWCTLNIVFLLHDRNFGAWWNLNVWPALIALVLALVCYIPISYLKDADEFRWGASDWWSSMHTLVSHINYANHEGYIRLVEILLAVTFMTSVVSSFLYIKRKGRNSDGRISNFRDAPTTSLPNPSEGWAFWHNLSFVHVWKFLCRKGSGGHPIGENLKCTRNDFSSSKEMILCIVALLSFIILSSLAQHILLHTMFMDGRKATMYTTLILCLVILVWKKIPGSFAIPTLAAYFILSFLTHIQLKSVREWFLDAHITEALHSMKEKTNQSLTITCSWELQTPLQFYNQYFEDEKLLLHTVEKKGGDFGDRFWLITNRDIDKLPAGVKMLGRYDNQTYLFQR